MTTITGVATLAIAEDRGWSLPGLGDDGPKSVTVVLSRHGGTVYAAPDDVPGMHLSGILARQGVASAEIPPFRGTDAQWNRLVQCVHDRFEGFDVTIVDEPPIDGEYTLAHIGGTPDLLGYSDTVGGIAPHADRVLEGSVVFVFQPKGIPARALCETTAHEIGHTLGLDHTRDCSDIMSYETCGNKEFVAAPSRCGEWEDRACESGEPTQSSAERLAAAVGRRGVRPRPPHPAPEPPPVARDPQARPTLEVRRSALAAAGQPFSIIVEGTDPSLRHVDLYWYSQRGHRLRCGEPGPLPFTCERDGDRTVFTLHPSSGGARKFFVRVTEAGGRMTRTPAYRVTLERAR